MSEKRETEKMIELLEAILEAIEKQSGLLEKMLGAIKKL
jgi:hypothetical protein